MFGELKDQPVELAIIALQNNRDLQQVPPAAQVIQGAWGRAGRILLGTSVAVLVARWCGWIEIAFLLGVLGAGWMGIMAWMTVRCLFSGNFATRMLLAGGIAIPAAVMAAGYTGLSFDVKAGRDVAWFGILQFGKPDYVIFITGAVLFVVVLCAVAWLQARSQPSGART